MMRRTLIIGLTLVATYAFGFATSVSAMGAEYTYKVNKANLLVGQAEEVTLQAKTSQTMSSSILGIKLEIVCKKLKLDGAEEPIIKGGIPGTSARDKFDFSECKAKLENLECREVTVEGGHLQGEIVTVVLPSTKAGELATKFSPSSSGTPFATIKLGNCGGSSFTVKCEGTIVLLDTPEKTEQSIGTLVGKKGNEEITEVQKSTGAKEKVGLRCSGVLMTFEGESEMALVSKASWGIF
jgi:hypothetical protein